MQTIADKRLTLAYLQKLGRENYFATAGSVLIITVSFLWMLFRIGGGYGTGLYGDVLYTVAAWFGTAWSWMTAYRGRYGPVRLVPRHQLAWFLIGLGLFLYGLGGAIFTYLEQIGHLNPVPSASDIGFTLFYPLTFAGLILMPTELTSKRLRLRTALDALITTLCLLGVSWFFFISRVFEEQVHQKASTLALITVISYPCWDILLILAIALLIWRQAERLLHPSLFICGAGVLALIWADTGYAYFTALGTYTSGTFYIDTFWFVAGFLIGLSALYQYAAIARRVYNERTHPVQMAERAAYAMLNRSNTAGRRSFLLQSSLIYLPLTILLVLTLGSEVAHDEERALFLVVLTAIVGVLVAIRYLLATQENERLLQEREQQREDAERLRLLATQLTEVLELDPLFERIITLATSESGFDASMLVLFEKSNHSLTGLNGRPEFSVRATASPSFEIRTWRFQDDRLPQCVAALSKEVEVDWAEKNLPLPRVVRLWQEEQEVERTLFMPLLYQGKVLGSLGFYRRAVQPFSQRDSHIARVYAEQAATAIEHAHLYHQLSTAHQRLQELDKLKDQFMITASHELRTPLTAVQGYLDLIAQFGETLSAEQRQEFVQKAQRGCEELVLLLHNVMDASRLEIDAGIRPAHMERVSVREVAQSVVDLIEPQLVQEERKLYLYIPDHLAVRADPARLRQVMRNLSVNAMKYSPPGSPITISAHLVKDQVPSIIISVIDKGKGISLQESTRLFQRFVRLERDMNSVIRGSGLGLYISRRLIEAMDGKIWIESKGIPGEGSTFHVQLPMAD